MYTTQGLLDIHERSQRSLKKLLESCRVLSPEELGRELPGFGYRSVRAQLEHIISSADYWFLVLEGGYKDQPEADTAEGTADGAAAADEVAESGAAPPRYPDIDALEAYRAEIDAISREQIGALSAEQLSTPSDFYCWPGKWRSMLPAHIVLRVATHVYHHQGQALAMCRQLGHVFEEGFDFPLD